MLKSTPLLVGEVEYLILTGKQCSPQKASEVFWTDSLEQQKRI